MTPGSVYFDEQFHFHDGETGEKLFVVLGSADSVIVVAKTTSQQHGRGVTFGCQPADRFHNFFIPMTDGYLKKPTWVCLDEFYDLNAVEMLNKRFTGRVKHICALDDQFTRLIQDCSLQSLDISEAQDLAVRACLV
ncbi:hypothetical protein ALQ38_03950 [Pseudomonas marginalis pv. marginalis]|uniref:Uncharacterized protein n=2 Tax=Pseudomonas marginalis TaxID=298 RepID=A0A9X5KUM4_PSEMA|nr:hypothetical protein AO064_25785 [Pseudomonas marginalis]RMO62607.1 hypothetical protein ALQ38_03950 [Pseudomonas marginalis pv. marginalis]